MGCTTLFLLQNTFGGENEASDCLFPYLITLFPGPYLISSPINLFFCYMLTVTQHRTNGQEVDLTKRAGNGKGEEREP